MDGRRDTGSVGKDSLPSLFCANIRSLTVGIGPDLSQVAVPTSLVGKIDFNYYVYFKDAQLACMNLIHSSLVRQDSHGWHGHQMGMQ